MRVTTGKGICRTSCRTKPRRLNLICEVPLSIGETRSAVYWSLAPEGQRDNTLSHALASAHSSGRTLARPWRLRSACVRGKPRHGMKRVRGC